MALLRLADGRAPLKKMALLPAFVRLQMSEAKTAKALQY